jgi:hypothetical protein
MDGNQSVRPSAVSPPFRFGIEGKRHPTILGTDHRDTGAVASLANAVFDLFAVEIDGQGRVQILPLAESCAALESACGAAGQ